MPSDWMYLRGNGSQSHGYPVGGYNHLGDGDNFGPYATPSFVPNIPVENRDFPGPLMNGFEFQPMETCPKNFIIFDQTDNKSRVMFHPALAHNFSYQSFDIHPSFPHELGKSLVDSAIANQGKLSSSMKECTEEIDALLCSEEEEEDDDDVISTGHTPCYGRGSPRYSSSPTGGSTSQKTVSSSSAQSSFSSSANSSGRKRERMRKMVKTLRQIIPGGEQLDTPAILDEAVRYLKSLKVEAKKLGIQNLEE